MSRSLSGHSPLNRLRPLPHVSGQTTSTALCCSTSRRGSHNLRQVALPSTQRISPSLLSPVSSTEVPQRVDRTNRQHHASPRQGEGAGTVVAPHSRVGAVGALALAGTEPCNRPWQTHGLTIDRASHRDAKDGPSSSGLQPTEHLVHHGETRGNAIGVIKSGTSSKTAPRRVPPHRDSLIRTRPPDKGSRELRHRRSQTRWRQHSEGGQPCRPTNAAHPPLHPPLLITPRCT